MTDNNEEFMFEDISSSSLPKTKSSLKAITENYGNGVFKHLDRIIKAISFIVAIGILLIFAAIAVAAVVGFLSIKLVKLVIKNDKFKIFGIYTIILGILCIGTGIYEHVTGTHFYIG